MCRSSKFITLVLWIWCKLGLAFSYEYVRWCLLEMKWDWGIEFQRPNEAHIFLTTNERCSEMHWFSIILPKGTHCHPAGSQMFYRCARFTKNGTHRNKNASRTLQCKVWNVWMMHFHQHAELCGFQAKSLDVNTVNDKMAHLWFTVSVTQSAAVHILHLWSQMRWRVQIIRRLVCVDQCISLMTENHI